MIYHTCMCGAEIEISSTQDHGQIRCPQCGMSVALGQRSLKPSKGSATGTTKELPDFSPDETGAEPDTKTDLFSLEETESINERELMALSKSTSRVASGIRAFRIGVAYMILCAFLIGLRPVFDYYHVNPTIAKIVTFTTYGLAVLTTFYFLLGWFYWSKVAPPNLTIRRNLLTPLLATSKFGFWILFFVPVAAGFFMADTWVTETEAAIISHEDEPKSEPEKIIDPLDLEKRVTQIVDVPSHVQGGLFGKVGMGFLLPAIVLPALLTLSIFQIRRFLASWRRKDFNGTLMVFAITMTFVLTLLAAVPIVGFLVSVVVGLFWNRQLTRIGNESIILLSKLGKVSQS